jgi:predicted secreted protein
MMMECRACVEGEAGQKLDPWLQAELEKLGVKAAVVEKPWWVLNDQAVTVYDAKLYGTLLARLAEPREPESLKVILDGTEPGSIALDRKDGATKLVARKLGGLEQDKSIYLAFRVEKAAKNWPAPLDVGPESDGKVVKVAGTREVVIALPGNKASGCTWVISKVQGDAIKGGAVKAVGQPQFTPGAGAETAKGDGTFENVLRVVEKGKSDVELQYKRLWQADAPPEKTFRVTLEVQDIPPTLPANSQP